MNQNREAAVGWYRVVRAVVIGTIAGTLVCLLLLVIMAAIIAARDIPAVAVAPMAVIAAATGALVGGFLCARIAGEKGLLLGALCGVLLHILILLAGTIWFRDSQSFYWLIKLAVLVGCGGVGGVLGVNLKKR